MSPVRARPTVETMLMRRTRTISTALIALAAIVAVLSATFAYVFLAEYGPTTGSRVDGARAGVGSAAVGLIMMCGLAVAGLVVGRRWRPGPILAATVMAAGLLGVLVSGAQAAVVKYDGLPKVPNCIVGGSYGSPDATLQDAFAGIAHPQPVGAGWSSGSGCGANLLNTDRETAATYYRQSLPTAGWTIGRDDATELRASHGELVFTLSERCGQVTVVIEQGSAPNPGVC
jgi:hypothetical protein